MKSCSYSAVTVKSIEGDFSVLFQWRGEKQVTKPLRVLPASLARDRALVGLWSP